MKNINYKSDFKYTEVGAYVAPFRFTYKTMHNTYVASWDGTTYTNCKPIESGIMVIFDNHRLEPGELKVNREVDLIDDDFADGICNFNSFDRTGIMLTIGKTDDSDYTITPTPFYQKGDPGDSAYLIAVANGFTGSEAEWLASLHGQDADIAGANKVILDGNAKITEMTQLGTQLGQAEQGRVTAEQGREAAEVIRERKIAEMDKTYATKVEFNEKYRLPFITSGKYISANGIIADTQNNNIITDYIDIATIGDITINGRSTNLVMLYAYYDESKKFISGVYGSQYHNVDVVARKSDRPSNARYIIANGGNIISDKFQFSISDVEIKKGLDGLNEVHNKIFKNVDYSSKITRDGYYMQENGIVRFVSVVNYKSTEAIDVNIGDAFEYFGTIISGTLTSCHAMLDTNKNPIGIFRTDSNFIITEDMYNSGVRYVAFSYRPDDEKKLTANISYDIGKIVSDVENLKSRKLNIGSISGIGTMGASLMYNGNNWVEDGCAFLGVTAYNKAESGVGNPTYFANKIWRETYCTEEEFESIDILAIQFASSGDVFTLPSGGENKSISDYESGFDIASDINPFSVYTSAQCFDYILKKWQSKCYAQRNISTSKWYNTPHGKPCRLLFVTHWHDGRIAYNNAIRLLAEKWGAGICEFDKKIGFSKNAPMGDGTMTSILYAVDTRIEDNGVLHGWHPLRGSQGLYIQKKMANIFADSLLSYDSML